MINRKKGPMIKSIEQIVMPSFDRQLLDNGTELVSINLGTQPIINVEILYKGGRFLETKKGTAKATARLLKEGTQSYNSSQLAEVVDFYGASISSGANLDFTFIKLFSLSKYLPELLPVLSEIVYQPTFPEKELTKYIQNSKERLKIESVKSEILAYRIFTDKLYGDTHPYGYNSTDEIYESLTRADLLEYYNQAYGSDNCTIVLSGHVTPEIKKMVIDHFGTKQKKTKKLIYNPFISTRLEHLKINIDDKSQTSIRLGMPLFNRTHEDFNDFYVLNTILGGYFSSRLMKSIREEKGYTYGIYSSMDMMIFHGYFSIAADVSDQYVDEVIDEIYRQINILKNELVPDQELKMVKNYINGNILNLIDGPFRIANMAKVISLNDLNTNFYEDLSLSVTKITSERIQELAIKYFSGNTMMEVVVGNLE